MPPPAKADSAYGSRTFLSVEFSGTRVHAATEATCDLLRHEAGALRIFESRSFMIVRRPGNHPEQVAAATLSRPFRFSSEDGTFFTTARGVDPMSMSGWERRVDAVVRGGCVDLLLYKRISQRLGFDGSAWFSSG